MIRFPTGEVFFTSPTPSVHYVSKGVCGVGDGEELTFTLNDGFLARNCHSVRKER
jgi:hypothetical protein